MSWFTGFKNCLILVLSIGAACMYFLIMDEAVPTNSTNSCQLGESRHEIVNKSVIFGYRSLVAAVVLSTCAYLLFDANGLHLTLLIRGQKVAVHAKHFHRFTAFTVWCWISIGLYMTLAAICSYYSMYECSSSNTQLTLSHPLLFFTQVLFEIAFSMSYLVTLVVTFVLIPGTIKSNMPVDIFYDFFPLLFHNLNVIVMCMEMLINNITFTLSHIPYIILYGLTYIIFAWVYFHFTGIYFAHIYYLDCICTYML